MEDETKVEVADAMATAAEELVKEKEDNSETRKEKLIRYFLALFFEYKKKKNGKGKWVISVGRVSWWLAFSPALYIWISTMGKQDIAEHHLTVLLLLAGYNFGKKVVDGFVTKKEPETDGPG